VKVNYDILAEKDFQYYRLTKDISHHIGDLLATVTDILQPRSFEEFEQYGFA
jgi:internalin A